MKNWSNKLELASMKKLIILGFASILFVISSFAQEEDLLSLLQEEEKTEYIEAAFKTNRVINMHSLENTSAGVLDIKISHRFGFINGGPYELFGLDQATIRIGGDLGISDRLAIGFGRSSFEKTYDGFAKFLLLRQSKGLKKMPITLAVVASGAIKTVRPADDTRENLFSSKLYYSYQIILGRKFSDRFSFQLSPMVVHRNLVSTVDETNDVYALGMAFRQKLSNRISLNAEYVYVFPNQILPEFHNSLSIGFDIETGGHVFQLHFSNSTSMIEKGFVAETVGNWGDGGIHFGFNISRVFTL